MNFNITPTLVGKLLRVQDYLILEIINDIGLEKPIYFAATVSDRNQIGLQNYLLMEGMTYRLKFAPIIQQINYNKMKQNLKQANLDVFIKTAGDYNLITSSSENGIYRYTNLNDTSIHYSDNIKRLVQNYRIGFIRLAEHELLFGNEHKNSKAEKYIQIMDEYFPEKILPIEPGISILISDSIYFKTGNIEKQMQILNKLFHDNSLPIETKIYLLHKFADLNNQSYTLEVAMFLINDFHDQLDFELQKFLGDILADYIEQEEFVNFCDSVLNMYHLKGLLYPLVRVLHEMNQEEKAINIIEDWVQKNPDDRDLIELYNYLIEMKSFQ